MWRYRWLSLSIEVLIGSAKVLKKNAGLTTYFAQKLRLCKLFTLLSLILLNLILLPLFL